MTEAKLRDYLRRATEELRRARHEAREREERDREPIAVVSMACRLPGPANDPRRLWRLLADGVDAVGPFPTDRGWDLDLLYHPDPDHAGTSYTNRGTFIEDVSGFDAALFGINPHEALAMDPQQRHLLEVTWELLERAGLDPLSAPGDRTGVFVGTNGQDYLAAAAAGVDAAGSVDSGAGVGTDTDTGGNGSDVGVPAVEGYLGTGASAAVLSGRLAYTFGFGGPALSVDTACSSSLVAIHLAVRSLRTGESDLAVAGGVTIMATPAVYLWFSRQRGLAPDGRCKAFAAAADGTGFGEGVGLLLLERLSQARRHRHPVLAVIRGSAVNQDGTSNGLTAPNGPAQERVIREALADARLRPGDIDVVEAHGTGTALGDPLEAQALLNAYGRNRAPDRPLWIGSVKSNIGHTQAAAGVAGAIKMVQAIRYDQIPRTLHVDAPTPHVDWNTGPVRPLTTAVPWPARPDAPRRAAVSSFGISGTNAHLILEEAPAHPDEPPADALARPPWLISAATVPALQAHAGRIHRFLSAERPPDAPAAPVAATPVAAAAPVAATARALATRPRLRHRAVIVPDFGADPDTGGEIVSALAALADGRGHPNLIQGNAPAGARARSAFLFAGQGSQYPGMGRGLYRHFPAYRQALDEMGDQFAAHLARPLRDVILAAPGTPDSDLLRHTSYTQCALFALETALFRLVEPLLPRPDYLVGHSLGELVAAHVAGVLTLADACALVATRGQLMGALPEGGAMVAVSATEDETERLIAGHEEHVGVAAVNSPNSVVLAGDVRVLDELLSTWRAHGRQVRRLAVSHAFHSPLMRPVLDDFARVARQLTYHPPRIPIVSNRTGQVADPAQLADAGYWIRQIRDTVRFHQSVRTLHAQRVRTYVEIGPRPTLSHHTLDCLPANPPVLAVCLLRLGHDDRASLLTGLARAHVLGHDVDWRPLTAGARSAPADLPTYPFQHRPFWLGRSPRRDALRPHAPRRHSPAPAEAVPGSAETGPAPAETAPVRAERVRARAGVAVAPAGSTAAPGSDESPADRLRHVIATVLGLAGPAEIDPDAHLRDLGFDSLTLTALRLALATAFGVDLPVSDILAHPTPAALAAHLDRLGDAPDAGPARTPPGDRHELDMVVRQAVETGHGAEVLAVLAAFAAGLPMFAGLDDMPAMPDPELIATGPDEPVLICLRTIMPSIGGFEYTRFAARFQGRRDVHLVPRPGFREGEPLPATLDALVAAQTATVRRCAAGRPFVLVGHSSGGLIGHLVAAHLEHRETPPAGLVLLDTAVLRRIDDRLLSATMRQNYGAWGEYLSRSRQALAAMGWYYHLLAGCDPDRLSTPSLVVRAAAGLSAAAAFPARWRAADAAVTSTGDHLTIMSDHAADTATIVSEWLDRRR